MENLKLNQYYIDELGLIRARYNLISDSSESLTKELQYKFEKLLEELTEMNNDLLMLELITLEKL